MRQIFGEPPQSMAAFLKVELPPDSSWIGPAILPKRGKLIFGGNAKIGKSFFALGMAQALITGEPLYGCPIFTNHGKNVRVLVVEAELGPWELQKRSATIFSGNKEEHLERLFLYSQHRGFSLDDPEHVDRLTRRLKETGANVLILDPISKMHHYEESSNPEINRLFDKLEKILMACEDQDLALAFSHHFHKPPREDTPGYDPFSAYNFRGAGKWFDDPDTCITVVRVPHMKVGAVGKEAQGWIVKTKWETRRSAEVLPEGTTFTVHRNEDGKVIYEPDVLLINDRPQLTKSKQTPYNLGGTSW